MIPEFDCFGMAEARRDVAVFWCEIDYPVQPKSRMCASRVASRNSTSLGLVSLAGNRDEAVEGVIEADPIAAAVRALMAKQPEWTGTASKLLAALTGVVDERVRQIKVLAG